MASINFFAMVFEQTAAVIFILLLNGRSILQGDATRCGERKAVRSQLIVSGYDASPGAWPWHAAIYHQRRLSYNYACGGTLIGVQFVLTAAHCVVNPENTYDLPPERISVRLGVHNLEDLGTQQQHKVERIYKPDKFTSRSLRNDIAILELYTLAQLNDFVQPACLGIDHDLAGQFGTVVGWGFTEDEQTSPTLKSAIMPVIDAISCLKSNRDVFGPTLDETMLCAGYRNGTAVCNGDSGGGLFFQIGNVWYLGGIISFAQQRDHGANVCHTRSYGAFTKLDYYLPWISSITKLNGQSSNDKSSPDYLQTASCVTPSQQPGLCVAIERCRNIYTVEKNPRVLPAVANYIRKARCTLPRLSRSICCHPAEVLPEPLPAIEPSRADYDSSSVPARARPPGAQKDNLVDLFLKSMTSLVEYLIDVNERL